MKLEFKGHELQLKHPWTIARGKPSSTSSVVIVSLTGADGTVGVGEAAPSARYRESIASVQAFLKQVDPRGLSFGDIAGSMSYLDTLSRADWAAKCALNMALLDGAAKKARKPLHDFLGVGFREHHHVTCFSIGIDTPESIRQKVAEAAAYPVLKMKVGLANDKSSLQALREVEPVKPVRVDANEGWKSKEQALAATEWLAQDGHIQFVEQPLPATAPLKDWIWLKQRSPLPIFGDESYHRAEDLETAVECFHGVNVKLVKSGGISEAQNALQLAREAGLKTMIGCMIETSIGITAAAHLAELCDYLDLDGNLLIRNDPYRGVACEAGVLAFLSAPEPFGLRVQPNAGGAAS